MNRIVPFKKRKLDLERPVRVYRNIRLPGTYSICQDGRIVAHTTHLHMQGCEFKVSTSGQRRSRQLRKKTVHAWIVGHVCPDIDTRKILVRVEYNPFKDNHFMARSKRLNWNYAIRESDCVWITERGVFAI